MRRSMETSSRLLCSGRRIAPPPVRTALPPVLKFWPDGPLALWRGHDMSQDMNGRTTVESCLKANASYTRPARGSETPAPSRSPRAAARRDADLEERRSPPLSKGPPPALASCRARSLVQGRRANRPHPLLSCLLYTSDAADDLLCVDLGG